MTVVRKLQVQCKHGSMQWMYLKDMKASYTLELSEYAVKSKINEEPAFNRWVKDALQTRG